LSFRRPDYFIAKVNNANAVYENMEEWEIQEDDFFHSGDPYRDYHYLRNMSADVAPVLIPFMAERGAAVEDFYRDDVFEEYNAKKAMLLYMTNFISWDIWIR